MNGLTNNNQLVNHPSGKQITESAIAVTSGADAGTFYPDDLSDDSSWFSVTLLLLIGLVVFVLWAALFEIEQTVRAQGQAIPIERTQVIQVADGGVLAELLVREGESVVAGQRLAVLEKERVNAAYEDSRTKVAALRAALVRSKAESEEEAPLFGSEFEDFTDFVVVQSGLYEQRKRGVQDQLDTLQNSIDMAQEELSMNRSLFKTGDISRLDVMRTKRQVSELEGKFNAVRNKYLQEARQEVAKLEAELASARYKFVERKNVLEHTEIVAPVAGVVKYLKVNTVGGVLRSGDELMQISPTGGDMVIEVRVDPVDIGQLRIGLPVSVKLDAFDYFIYGSMYGTLTYISADTLNESASDGRTVTYYRAQVRIDDDKTKSNLKLSHVQLKPGMTATVDIKTNTRSVLQYLAKPVVKAFGGALNER